MRRIIMPETIEIPKRQLKEMKATIETLEDEEVMRQIRESEGAPSKSLEEVREEIEGQ
ncbi:MAG: hypothetical protein ACLFSS_02305 [Candidatus Aenigmatarchaeota archaeon]